jgi:hypothetical protein
MRATLVLILFLFAGSVFSQENPVKRIDSLFTELTREQAGSENFAKGIFPSYRIQSKGKERFADDNIFFSAIIAMRLKRLEKKIPEASKQKAFDIIKNVQEASKAYENKYGRISYNFWQTKPVKQFPNDKKLTKKTRYHIPDDADDSAILFLVNGKSKREVMELQKMMEENVPGKKRNIRNTLPKFRTLPAYSTWLGDRMPPEFDFCVLANILYVFSEYDLPYTTNEWATITFLRESFLEGDLQKKSYRVSPQYKTESTCLYHFAFLMSAHKIAGLDELKPQLIKRINEKLAEAQTRNEALLLVSALSYLNQVLPTDYTFPKNESEFPFFYANLGSVTPNPFNGVMSKSHTYNYPYECRAWNIMLELEILLNVGSRQ